MVPSLPATAIGKSSDRHDSNLVVRPSSAHGSSRLNQWHSAVSRSLPLHEPSNARTIFLDSGSATLTLVCLLLDATHHTGSVAVSGAKAFCPACLRELELRMPDTVLTKHLTLISAGSLPILSLPTVSLATISASTATCLPLSPC